MNEELYLKLQAYLDGELAAGERAAVETLLAEQAEARALLTELRQTAAALAGFETNLKLSDSREFYWSKIQREISRQPAGEPAAHFSWAVWLRRMLIPAGAMAAVTVAVLLSLPRTNGGAGADLTDAAAFTYHNYATGTTLVWLDYSSENDFSASEPGDTLDL